MNQSALVPAGDEAEAAYGLLVVMTVGGSLILIAVVVLAGLAIFGGERLRASLSRERLIVAGGLAFPVVTLAALLAFGLSVMGGQASTDSESAIRIEITGEMWWWRVRYELADGTRFESANEVRLPVGQPVELALMTADVIHSFWAPAIAGKLDMIPGRTNTMTVTATQPGIVRGQCAEYCGGAHAFMAFHVVSSTPEEFATWAATEAGPAREASSASDQPANEAIQQGETLFQSFGCGGCHNVRGTPATGTIGPDLTHVGSRFSLAAGTLANDAPAFAAWIENNQHIKPENAMPQYDILEPTELADLASYLESLK